MDERLRILARSAALGDFDARNQLVHYLDSLVEVLFSTRYTEWGNYPTAQRELNALSEFVVNFAAERIETEYYPDKIAVLFSLVQFKASENYPDTMRPDRIYFIIGRFRELPNSLPQPYYFVRVKFGQWRDVDVQILARPVV